MPYNDTVKLEYRTHSFTQEGLALDRVTFVSKAMRFVF
jgi:hypothetical protein